MGGNADVFGILLPLGVFSVPIAGYMVDNYGFSVSLFAVLALGFMHSVLSMIQFANLQPVTFLIFGVFRGFLFSVANTYAAHTFGMFTIGRVFGLAVLVGSICSLVQIPLYEMSVSSGSFFVSNSIVFILSLLALLLPCLEWRKRKLHAIP